MADKEELEQRERLEAVRIAGEWAKQLGLWATGTLVISLSFLKDFVGDTPISTKWLVLLVLSWIALILSIIFGHFGFGAPLTGTGRADWRLRVNAPTRRFAIFQMAAFVIGLLGIVIFATFHMPRT